MKPHVTTRLKKYIWGKKVLYRLRQQQESAPVAPVGGKHPRVLIGPSNSAGQAHAWSQSLNQHNSDVVATSMQFTSHSAFSFDVSQRVPSGYGAYSRSWQKKQFRALQTYAAVLIESGLPLCGDLFHSNTRKQVEKLQEAGVRVGLVFHGSDVRHPDRHLQMHTDSYFQTDVAFTERMRDVTNRNYELIDQLKLTTFVSTLDLLSDVPQARWLPVVVDTEKWRTETPPLVDNHVPRVVHIPSRSSIKGSELIAPILKKLEKNGLVHYQELSGVNHAEMPKILSEADIVLDQFRGGPYGVAACEAMAAGRIVISHVPHRDRIAENADMELPIVEATAHTLEDAILSVLDNPKRARENARDGVAYVSHMHDGRQSAHRLAEWLKG